MDRPTFEASHQDLRGRRFEPGTLRGAVLDGARLENTDLSGQDLRGASLRGARLTHADLRGSDLTEADLTRADLSFARLDRAALQDAILLDARVLGASMLRVSGYFSRSRLIHGDTAAWDVSAPQAWVTGGAESPVELVLSPDGALIVSRAKHGGVRVWDTASGQMVRALPGPEGTVWCVAFSPAESVLATGASDDRVRLWELATGRERLVLGGHRDGVTGVAWSPDGRKLLSAGDDLTLHLWDTTTGRRLAKVDETIDHHVVLTWSADGRRIAAGNDAGMLLVSGGSPSLRLTDSHGEWIYCLAWSPDGKYLATGADDHKIRLWLAVGEDPEVTLWKVLRGHTDKVTQVVWSADSKALLSASADATMRVWNTTTAKSIGEASVTPGDAVAWDRDGRPMVYGLGPERARDLPDAMKVPRRTLESPARAVNSVAFRADGRTLASTTEGGQVNVWDLATGAVIERAKLPDDRFSHVAWNPAATMFAMTTDAGKVMLWNTQGAGELRQLPGRLGKEPSVAWHPDGRTLAVTALDRHPRRRDVATGEVVESWRYESASGMDPTWSLDGKTLAARSSDGAAPIWNVGVRGDRTVLESEDGKVTCVAVNHDGEFVVAASMREEVMVHSTKSMYDHFTLTGHPTGMRALAFSPEGRHLAGIPFSETILLWDLTAKRKIANLAIAHALATKLAWSPDGRFLAAGCTDGTVRVWAIPLARCVGVYVADEHGSVAFRPDDGRYRLTGACEHAGHTIGLARYKLGELDEFIEGGLRLRDEDVLLQWP